MRQHNPLGFKEISRSPALTFAAASCNSTISIRVLDENIVHIRHVPSSPPAQILPVTYTIATGDIPVAGRLREDIPSSFPCPSPEIKQDQDGSSYNVSTPELNLHVNIDKEGDLTLSWSSIPIAKSGNSSTVFLQDLNHRAYTFDKSGRGVWHYVRRIDGDLHYGLGERASPLLLNRRRFRLECLDALGYLADSGDPLYKFNPMYITLNKDSMITYGIFYDNLSTGYIDFGCEQDAFWGDYRAYHASEGSLDYYVVFGGVNGNIERVIEGFTKLVGLPKLPPKYAFGYLASSMGYAESDDAQQLLEAFPDLCRKHNIPCDLIHLSSGYTGRLIQPFYLLAT